MDCSSSVGRWLKIWFMSGLWLKRKFAPKIAVAGVWDHNMIKWYAVNTN